ncbi:MAG TPA: Pvc16 family protein [Thermoanaerobaculia bacterium]|nr:Pvc16 family protein [Thermoanaerobaculia bacterium]
MIAHLDNLLRHLLVDRIGPPVITSEDQVGFQPPDQDWRNHVGTLSGMALNLYLVALTENRKLRSNERVREIANGAVGETPAPRRLDCHYLITAWSPATPSPLIEPTVDEHALLYQVTAVLTQAEPMVARRIYAPAPLPAGFPEAIADAELPSTLLTTEGLPQMSDFWSTFDWRWKPGVNLTVTLPVLYERRLAGPMVTTRITEYRQSGSPGTAEVWIQIGGRVATGAPAQPVPGAWVRLETPGGLALQTTTADGEGRFTFGGLAAGPYVLRVRAAGFAEAAPAIQVPSAAGGYDVEI